MPPIIIRSQPGVQRDGTRFDADAHVDAHWCRWVNGRPRKMGGYRVITDALTGAPSGCNSFSRDGLTYMHLGHSQGVQQVIFDSITGVLQGVYDRTPAMVSPNANYYWQFAIIFDPIINNDASIFAWPGVNLAQIDTDDEQPVFFGKLIDTAALIPMSLPIMRDGHTVTSFSCTTSNGVATVTCASTASIRKNMYVTGTGVPANARILSIDSATQFTLTANATTSATNTLTFKVGGVCGGIVGMSPYLFAHGSSGRIIHSTDADPNDFFGTGSNEAFITGQKIIRGLPTRGGAGNNPAGLYWSLDSLMRVTYVGGDAVFSYDTVAAAISIISPQSVVEHDGVYFWVGDDRFYMFAGTVRELPNTFNADYFFDGINHAHENKVFGYRVPRYGEIWWCYPRGTATECTHAIIYNTRLNVWYDTELPNGGRRCAENPVPFGYPVLAGHAVTDGGTYQLWQHETGVDEVEGSSARAIRSYFETGDVSLVAAGDKAQDTALQIDKLEPDFEQTGDMTVTLVGNQNARSPTYEEQALTFGDTPAAREELVNLKATRRQMRFRFESNTAGGNYIAGKIIAHIGPSDSRST
jgi:hypothetical protein